MSTLPDAVKQAIANGNLTTFAHQVEEGYLPEPTDHAQNHDTSLDVGGDNEVSAAEIKAAMVAGVGYSGYSGISGASGYSGKSGFSGAAGEQGVSGYSGYSGLDGVSGFSGAAGLSGYSGATGASGYSGTPGVAGDSGFSGANGVVAVLTGVVAPVSTPAAVGNIYVDTALKNVYIAAGTGTSGDWIILN